MAHRAITPPKNTTKSAEVPKQASFSIESKNTPVAIAQPPAIVVNQPKPVVQQQAQPAPASAKTQPAPVERLHPVVPALAAVQKEKPDSDTLKTNTKDGQTKSAAQQPTHPTTAVEKEKLAIANRKPSVPSKPVTLAQANAKTSQQATSGSREVPNPTFYVDLGPVQDPDSAKNQRSETADIGPAVIYRNGQLTIHAKDVTLAALLQMVAQKTRARIDVPSGDGTDPIAVHAGPAPVDEVLAQLLKGSPFNFVIVHSPQHPNELQQVLLTVRGPGEPASAAIVQADAEAPKQGLPKELLEKLFSRKRPDDVPPPADQTPPPSDQTTTPANGPTSPEAIEQQMKDKANEIRQNADQQ